MSAYCVKLSLNNMGEAQTRQMTQKRTTEHQLIKTAKFIIERIKRCDDPIVLKAIEDLSDKWLYERIRYYD